MSRRVVIMGAAGRDFHNFNLFFRNNQNYEVIAFTATQIPNIAGRCYPASLAGSLYPNGIPIMLEEQLPEIILGKGIDLVVLAYSDLFHEAVMHKASLALASGPDFMLLGPKSTMLESKIPVVAVTATRTGAGKSTVARYVTKIIRKTGKKIVVIRHPMPYGDLTRQAFQRFATHDDLVKHQCTIEEREEYEPHIDAGNVVYAGVDYTEILKSVEKEAEIIVWDGGNNDLPFIKPLFHITVVDAHRPGQETITYPGEINLLLADLVIVNKVDTAPKEGINRIKKNVRKTNYRAKIMVTGSKLHDEFFGKLRGKRVVVIEDGPTLTHGGMTHSIGYIIAVRSGAEIVDPRVKAIGLIKDIYEQYNHIGPVLPAMGYRKEQTSDLEATIRNIDCDIVVSATPIDLTRLIKLDKPVIRVLYELDDFGQDTLTHMLKERGLLG